MNNSSRDASIEYQSLFDKFISGDLLAEDFQKTFLSHFKAESRCLENELFDVLEEAFGDVDSYTSEPDLLLSNPDFYINEARLRQKIETAKSRISELMER